MNTPSLESVGHAVQGVPDRSDDCLVLGATCVHMSLTFSDRSAVNRFFRSSPEVSVISSKKVCPSTSP